MAEPHLIAGHVAVGFPVPDRGHAEEKIGWIRAGSDDVQPIPCSLLSWSSGGRWSTFRVEERTSSSGELPLGSFPGHVLALNVGPPYALDVCSSGELLSPEHAHLTGNFNFIPASMPISAVWRGPATVVLIEISGTSLGPDETMWLEPVVNRSDEFVAHVVLALRALASRPSLSGPGYGEALCSALSEHLLRGYRLSRAERDEPKKALSSNRFRRVLEYVDAHLVEAIDLGTLAREYGMSTFHFARLFKRRTGIAPHQFIIRRRMERARVLLSDGDLSVSEVGFRCGFSQRSHFTSTFRRTFGVSPSVYRGGL